MARKQFSFYRPFFETIEKLPTIQAKAHAYEILCAFALDETGSVLAGFNSSNMLPQTVVVDETGVIAYNQVGSLTYEALEQIVLYCMAEEAK